MSGEDKEIIIELIELIAYRSNNVRKIAARQICASDATIKQRIAAKYAVRLAEQANAAGSMAGSM